MHLIPTDRLEQRVIDGDAVCDAIEALGKPADVNHWASRYALLGDPTRLALLICIHRAGPIAVSDLAVATGNVDATVSQALRYLRAAGVVSVQREGRIMRYSLADDTIITLIEAATSR